MSEVLLSVVNASTGSSRLDAEFFQNQYLAIDRILHKKYTESLVEITSKIDVGFVGSMKQHYREDGIPLLQTKNIAEFFVSDLETIKITPEFHRHLHKSKVSFEDILIARSGSFGKASIFLKRCETNSSDIIIIKVKKNGINPYYLTAFLNSSLGVSQMIRFASGGLQGHVNLTILEELQVPILGLDFQNALETTIKNASKKIETANQTYAKAETLLLDALNLADFSPSSENTNIKSFKESFAASGRLDAEHYQPKFDEIEALIKSNGVYCKRVEEIQTYNSRGMTAIYEPTGTVDMITQKHILETGLDYDNFDKTDISHFPADEAAFVAESDILIYGTGANIGRTQPYLAKKKAVACQDIIILRVTEDPVYVAFVINSFIGRLQTEKMKTGSAQPHLYPKDIAQFLIPFVGKGTQEKIREKIISSLALKKQSAALLETAKRAVEIAIEQDEAAALAFIAVAAENLRQEVTV